MGNYLPICRECNGLRGGYRPEVIRLILRLGIYAKQEIVTTRTLATESSKSRITGREATGDADARGGMVKVRRDGTVNR